MSLPKYKHILKSPASGKSGEKTVVGAGRCLLSRTHCQDIDRDMTCPYYPRSFKLWEAL